jgi:hypothetical protein
MKVDENEIAKEVLHTVALEIDVDKMNRALFGCFDWRLKVATFLFKLSAIVLKINCEIKTNGDENEPN